MNISMAITAHRTWKQAILKDAALVAKLLQQSGE
jgi:hypothetical protein